MEKQLNRRVIAAATIGNVLEWYDFAIYGLMAPILAFQFFPTSDPLTSLMAAFAVFALGYLVRPLSALMIGGMRDRVGGRTETALSIVVMSVPTGLMAVVPNYAAAGIAAPVVLTVLRLLQGLSVGGESTSSGVFLVERPPRRQRGLVGSVTGTGSAIGILLASATAAALAATMPAQDFAAWGWRLAFVVGPIIGVVGYVLRRGIVPEEPNASEPVSAPAQITEALQNHGGVLLRVAIISASYGVAFCMAFVFLTSYLTDAVRTPLGEVLGINTAAVALLVVLVPVFGWISDDAGRKAVMFMAAAGLTVMAYPLFLLLYSGDPMLELTGDFAFAILAGAFAGPYAAWMSEQFPRRVRRTAMLIACGLPAAILGGATPFVATWLIAITGNDFSPALYVAVFAAAGAVAMFFTDETKDLPLD